MIILDLSNLLHINVYKASTKHADGTTSFDPSKCRNLLLQDILDLNKKFKKKYGRIVMATDAKSSWRKKAFVHYKANRKVNREKQVEVDWAVVFEFFRSFEEEIKTYSHYPIIKIDLAEGDDIIAALALNYSDESNIIVSRDKDFKQLQAFTNVTIFDPIDKKIVEKEDNPLEFLKSHIISGDQADGIPNILSDDDVFINETKRQSPMSKFIKPYLMNNMVDSWDEDALGEKYKEKLSKAKKNYERNRVLVDLRECPQDIYDKIIQAYEDQADKIGKGMVKYFTTFKLSNLMNEVNNF